ncbi:hypothetical protein QYF36_026123 [Acer negundo]|nr:hypothetical protein QYF36_026123 [Acer negundo]
MQRARALDPYYKKNLKHDQGGIRIFILTSWNCSCSISNCSCNASASLVSGLGSPTNATGVYIERLCRISCWIWSGSPPGTLTSASGFVISLLEPCKGRRLEEGRPGELQGMDPVGMNLQLVMEQEEMLQALSC